MKCEVCRKNSSKTFRREGGLTQNPKSGKEHELKKWYVVCLPCIKRRIKAGHFWEAPIITNPTIMPSGDPTEWVINE